MSAGEPREPSVHRADELQRGWVVRAAPSNPNWAPNDGWGRVIEIRGTDDTGSRVVGADMEFESGTMRGMIIPRHHEFERAPW